MGNKNWVTGLVILIIIIGLSVWGFSKNTSQDQSSQPSVPKRITGTEAYFSNEAKVMYFYQETCYYCLLQSPILADLATEGYRFKPMDAGKDQTMWQKYNVLGTPTFMAENGDRLEGYNEKEPLKAFLDAHGGKLVDPSQQNN